MVTTVLPPSDPRNRAAPGTGFDGVVRVSVADFYATGALLYDGRAVLTAAHLFTHGSTKATVHFETTAGHQSAAASRVLVHAAYDPDTANNDLALVWLDVAAPRLADRYELFREDALNHAFTLVGYGQTGSGSAGASGNGAAPQRLLASNRFDADAATLASYLGDQLAWQPFPGSQLVADFDDGTSTRDALGQLIQRPNLGTGTAEGLIAPGDSGGPAFVDGRLAGVATGTASLSRGSTHPDVDSLANSSFGEVAFWQDMSFHQQWVDQSVRAQYVGAPTRASEVKKSVAEGQAGTTLAWFLLEFTGVRTSASQVISVDYATRDGTAQAGSDYLAVQGRLNLYPGENHVAIPVEILGDAIDEADETFYLEVFNPVGGSFGEGVAKLVAVRTILDDDGA